MCMCICENELNVLTIVKNIRCMKAGHCLNNCRSRFVSSDNQIATPASALCFKYVVNSHAKPLLAIFHAQHQNAPPSHSNQFHSHSIANFFFFCFYPTTINVYSNFYVYILNKLDGALHLEYALYHTILYSQMK